MNRILGHVVYPPRAPKEPPPKKSRPSGYTRKPGSKYRRWTQPEKDIVTAHYLRIPPTPPGIIAKIVGRTKAAIVCLAGTLDIRTPHLVDER